MRRLRGGKDGCVCVYDDMCVDVQAECCPTQPIGGSVITHIMKVFVVSQQHLLYDTGVFAFFVSVCLCVYVFASVLMCVFICVPGPVN